MQRQDEDELELSAEALAALCEYAVEVRTPWRHHVIRSTSTISPHGLDVTRTIDLTHPNQRGLVSGPSAAVATDPRALRKTVQESCALTERDEGFEYEYGAGEVRVPSRRGSIPILSYIFIHIPFPSHHPTPRHPTSRPPQQGADGGPAHVIRLQGWKKELGQQLESTGLTMWRAGEDLGRYLYEKRAALFKAGKGGRHVLELGCGLGLCGILAARLNPQGVVVLTDGDEVTMDKVCCSVGVCVPYCVHDLALTRIPPQPTSTHTHAPRQLNANVEANAVGNGCAVTTRQLLWGEHAELLQEFPDRFDLVLAADVIYEESAVAPLVATVAATLRRDPEAVFVLSFARRNVSIDRVLEAATAEGLEWEADATFECSAKGEHVYRMRWKEQGQAEDN